jgi:Ca2+-binding RTX toxin-like protein
MPIKPTMTWMDGNGGAYRYSSFREYNTVVANNKKIIMAYDESSAGRPYDVNRSPFRIELVLKGAKKYTVEDGPDAGQSQYYAGTIKTVKYFNQDGNLIARITDLHRPVSVLQAMQDTGNDNDIFGFLLAGGATFMGSENSAIDPTDPDQWTGDDISTSSGDDIVRGKGGDDYIKDAGGADIYNGGAGGGDAVTYDEWFWSGRPAFAIQGVVADLKAGKATGPDGNVDKLISIENVYGSFLNDILKGDGQDNRFRGYAGDDTINGRAGYDRVEYRNDKWQGGTDGIRVNMEKGKVRDGFGNTDKLINIERVEGTEVRDVFLDSNGSDDFYFRGREGNDVFKIKGGNDTVRGDQGADTFVFLTSDFGDNWISDFSSADGDRIEVRDASSMADLSISDNGDGYAVISFSSGAIATSTISLYGVASASLSASDFIF